MGCPRNYNQVTAFKALLAAKAVTKRWWAPGDTSKRSSSSSSDEAIAATAVTSVDLFHKCA